MSSLTYRCVRHQSLILHVRRPAKRKTQAVIHEGLRIHPPFSGLLSKEVPAGGDILDGRYVPAGTCIGHSVFSMMRNKAVFGEDVDVFRPERWLDASPQGRARMHHTAGLGFGSGRWTCAGKTVALIQLNKIFVEVRSSRRSTGQGSRAFSFVYFLRFVPRARLLT